MNNLDKKTTQETHPLFPSGEWEGFYTYSFGPSADQHKMAFFLDFQNNLVKGTGSDDVGGFFWEGSYDKESLTCKVIKSYATHTVSYRGHVDENGIWGTWEMAFLKGGFHIWPKGNEESKQRKAKKKLSNLRKLTFDIPIGDKPKRPRITPPPGGIIPQ